MDILRSTHPETLDSTFFNRDAQDLATALLGKIIQVRQDGCWLMARVIETEAYYLVDKGSHSSLGFTEKRKALFMPPGTIYMYYAHGGDSLNFSARGQGNAVLIKSGYPVKSENSSKSLELMMSNNPNRDGSARSPNKLCSGQTLLCKSLGLKATEWDGGKLIADKFRLVGDHYCPSEIIQTTRLGIHPERDTQLPYRFIDKHYTKYCTKNPLRVRGWQNGLNYTIFTHE